MDNPFQYFVPSKSLNTFDENETEPKSQKRTIDVLSVSWSCNNTKESNNGGGGMMDMSRQQERPEFIEAKNMAYAFQEMPEGGSSG